MLGGGRETGRVLGVVPADTLEQMFAEAQRQVSAIPLAVPNRLPEQPMPVPEPIPLPTSVAPEALAMESSRKSSVGNDWLRGKTPSGVQVRPASLASPLRPSRPRNSVPDRDLIAATVRLRVHDDRGPSIGTGTIIDARGGKALILTCGHIFRDYREGGRIEVDLFGSASPQTVAGKLLSFDDKRDVGLLMIQAPGPVRALQGGPEGLLGGRGRRR
jgi:S1-C subfamily serine protease